MVASNPRHTCRNIQHIVHHCGIEPRALDPGASRVYLTPGSEKRLTAEGAWDHVSDYVLDSALTAQGIDRGQVQVYDVKTGVLRNITSSYRRTLRVTGLPLRVSVADPLTANLLGTEWYPVDVDHRWMGKRATLRMGAPTQPESKLILTAYAPPQLGALELTVFVNGIELPPAAVRSGSFETAFALPDAVAGAQEMQIALQVNKTFRPPGDPRDLSLSFGVFEVR